MPAIKGTANTHRGHGPLLQINDPPSGNPLPEFATIPLLPAAIQTRFRPLAPF
ncbi:MULTISPECIES: hypothetical protein [unclassified Microbulbifer]|uniref:hypothetical protein n=1 Tax=unclassified Microbulbifer TaxID=2619833 RepID=UPI0027E40C51|nr:MULTISPECIES: hypothetical protein [unclassified Microbulbifer]